MSLFPPMSPFSESSTSSLDDILKIASKTAMHVPKLPETQNCHDNSSDSTDYPTPSTPSSSECDQSADDSSVNQTETIKPYSRKNNYKRHPKPPYTYAGMIIMAIQMSPEKKLSLAEILQSIANMFPFFRGSYKGWKDSIRHTLSQCACFYKCPSGRANKWSVNLNLASQNVLQRQDTEVSRSQYWEPTIYQYLGVPEVVIPIRPHFIDHSAITSTSHHTPTTHQTLTSSNQQSTTTIQSRLSDFSIERILTPEVVDDSRPLQASETSPVFNKMSLKLKTRKSAIARKQNSSLSKLVIDSATKWGVSEESAVDQLRLLCKLMDANTKKPQHPSPPQPAPTIKQEIPSPPTISHCQIDQTTSVSSPSLPLSNHQMYQLPLDFQTQHLQQQQQPTSMFDQYYVDHFQQQQASYHYQQQLAAQQYQQYYAAQQFAAQQFAEQQYSYQQQQQQLLYQQQLMAAQQQMSHHYGYHQTELDSSAALDLSSSTH